MLERLFKLKEDGTDIKTEVLAGITTFMTMGYIVCVQPVVLSKCGMDFGAVMLATCLSSALATFLMGVMANYPIALAPAMGHNFFFVFTVCLAMGIPWQKALGAVFISGVLFLILSFFGMRERIVDAVPQSLKSGVAIIVALKLLKIRGSILLGIISAPLLGLHLKVVKFYGIAQRPPSISTLIGVSEEGGFMKNGKLPRAKEALLSDALGTVARNLYNNKLYEQCA